MCQRTLARTSLLVLALWAATAPAALGHPPAKHRPANPSAKAAASVPTILFPVVGRVSYRDDFGEPRGSSSHEGNDLMAARRAPAVAVEAGSVRIYDGSSRAGCMLYLYGDSGTTYLYIHLNNDRGTGNDNRAGCGPGSSYAPGLESGRHVAAGELIGYVGDSGDANWASPHLHFELRPGGGGAGSPFGALSTAPGLLYAFADTPRSRERIAAMGGVMLALAGTITALDAAGLTLDVERVRVSTGDRTIVADRQVTLALAPGLALEQTGAAGGSAVALDPALVGSPATVWTTVFAHGLDQQLAAPGTLTAARVLLGTASGELKQRSAASRGRT